jgi:hypothetical protein
MSPYVQLNYTGYTTKEYYNTKINVGLSQNLDVLTQGLSARLLFSYKTNGGHFVDRSMRPDLYYADPKMDDIRWNLKNAPQRTLSKWIECGYKILVLIEKFI